MRNYIYRSDRKIALFYAQVRQSHFPSLAKAGIKLGPVGAELETNKQSQPEDFEQQLRVILKRLEKEKQVGTIDGPKQFFKGSCKMHLLVDPHAAFFVGYEPEAKVDLVLCCSPQHMIGYENIKAYADECNQYVINSSNYWFARHLERLLDEEKRSESEEYTRQVIRKQPKKPPIFDMFKRGPFNVFHAAITAGDHCIGTSWIPVEFVAVTIASGDYEGKKALIGSPLYVDQLPILPSSARDS